MLNEEGAAAPRVLELLPRFWRDPRVLEGSQGFGVKCGKFIRTFVKEKRNKLVH